MSLALEGKQYEKNYLMKSPSLHRTKVDINRAVNFDLSDKCSSELSLCTPHVTLTNLVEKFIRAVSGQISQMRDVSALKLHFPWQFINIIIASPRCFMFCFNGIICWFRDTLLLRETSHYISSHVYIITVHVIT